ASTDVSKFEYYPDPNSFGSGVDPVVTFLDDEEIDGVWYRVYEFEHEDIVKEGHLNFELVLNGANCPSGGFGTAIIKMEVRSHCSDCDGDCPYTVGCAETELFYHCNGSCCTQIGTDRESFSFNRSTLGWEDNSFNSHVDVADGGVPLSQGGIALNRAYTCDFIEVKASGEIAADATCIDEYDSNDPDNTCPYQWCYNQQTLSEIYFMIEYESDINFQFFE